jgi:hypothetical protein
VGAAWAFTRSGATWTQPGKDHGEKRGSDRRRRLRQQRGALLRRPARSCEATLALAAQRKRATDWSNGSRVVTIVIGTAGVSVASGETTTVDFHLNHRGRKLLDAGNGHLPATLTIVKQIPKPEEEQTDAVEVVRQKAHHPGDRQGSGDWPQALWSVDHRPAPERAAERKPEADSMLP